MDYTKLNELKSQYGDYEEVFNSGDYDKAADILMKVLDVIELEYEEKRKAARILTENGNHLTDKKVKRELVRKRENQEKRLTNVRLA